MLGSLLHLKHNSQQTSYTLGLMTKAYLQCPENGLKFELQTEEKTTIGRTNKNRIQIFHSAVSRDHAVIQYLKRQNKFIVEDLGSVNGVLVNDELLSSAKRVLKHNDEILFGKSDQIYVFKESQPKPEKTGKINFKDYHFELDSDLEPKPPLAAKKQSPTKNQTTSNGFQENKEKSSVTGQKRFQRAIKIPNFEEFLELQDAQQPNPDSTSPNQTDHQTFGKHKKLQQTEISGQSLQNFNSKKWNQPSEIASTQQKTVKLPELNSQDLSKDEELTRKMIERKRQLEKIERQAQLTKAKEEQKILEERLRLQIEKAEKQEQIAQKKYEAEKQMKREEQRLLEQKNALKKKIQVQEKDLHQKQEVIAENLKQKEAQLVEQMRKEKEQELLRLKQREVELTAELERQKEMEIKSIQEKETHIRVQNQEKFKEELQRRKVELELEAQALARQYESIYKDTIKKMKLNIETQKQRVSELERQIHECSQFNGELQQKEQEISLQLDSVRSGYESISGKNKAFLLYASHLQSKMDQVRLGENLREKSLRSGFNKTATELKDSIAMSRKLLCLKQSERQHTQSNIKDLFLTLTANSAASSNSQEYLNTIMENYSEIEELKDSYFEFLEEEKHIEHIWDLQLEENSSLEEKCRNCVKEMELNRKKIAESLNDNLKKLTEQRIHILKMMHYATEQKKGAAKFLVEEMLAVEQETKSIFLDNEATHGKITDTILLIEDKRRENELLSEMLFGSDSTSHHFDNMKDEINRLMDCITDQVNSSNRVSTYLKASSELKSLESRIFQQFKREKEIKGQIKDHGHVIPALSTDKNPLVFFGGVLAKKEAEEQSLAEEEKQLQKSVAEARKKVAALTQKKGRLSKLMEDYRRSELEKVRSLI